MYIPTYLKMLLPRYLFHLKSRKNAYNVLVNGLTFKFDHMLIHYNIKANSRQFDLLNVNMPCCTFVGTSKDGEWRHTWGDVHLRRLDIIYFIANYYL